MGKSSCKSDLVLNNGNYDGELAQENGKFSGIFGTRKAMELTNNSIGELDY